MDTQDAIGKLLEGAQGRDAIHIAVAPFFAAESLKPGAHVGLNKQGQATAVNTQQTIGIVDPFLRAVVPAGSRFFVFLYPNTITSLRHVWTHPVIDSESEKDRKESEKWLRDFAEYNCSGYDNERTPEQSYEELLRMAEEGDFCLNGQPDELYDPQGQMKIWHHIERVRGQPFTPDHKENASFRCSC
jgi:hypothetical protein